MITISTHAPRMIPSKHLARLSFGETSLRSLDVVAQRLRFVLHLHEPVLDDIADRDDANKPVLLDHGEVAKLAGGHLLHDRAYGLGFVADGDFARHHLRQRFPQRRSAALGERTHDIALGQDAHYPPFRTEDDEGADPVPSESCNRSFENGSGLNGHDLTALGGQNSLHGHGRLHRTGQAPTARSAGRRYNDEIGAEFPREPFIAGVGAAVVEASRCAVRRWRAEASWCPEAAWCADSPAAAGATTGAWVIEEAVWP